MSRQMKFSTLGVALVCCTALLLPGCGSNSGPEISAENGAVERLRPQPSAAEPAQSIYGQIAALNQIIAEDSRSSASQRLGRRQPPYQSLYQPPAPQQGGGDAYSGTPEQSGTPSSPDNSGYTDDGSYEYSRTVDCPTSGTAVLSGVITLTSTPQGGGPNPSYYAVDSSIALQSCEGATGLLESEKEFDIIPSNSTNAYLSSVHIRSSTSGSYSTIAQFSYGGGSASESCLVTVEELFSDVQYHRNSTPDGIRRLSLTAECETFTYSCSVPDTPADEFLSELLNRCSELA